MSGASATDLRAAVAHAGVVVCTGAGGVGKTTTAAALALAAADAGRRTIVVTIDPARRLAQALGLAELDTVARPVAEVQGLDAMMLDMKRTFDEVIDRHAESPARAEAIKRNVFYEQMSSSLAGTQEYMAMEKLHELHERGAYECIVIDTPPTRNALDFLDAPRRMTDFLEGRFLRAFLAPGFAAGRIATRAASVGTGLFMKAASRITGASVLDDLGAFFQSMTGMYEGFKTRAGEVSELLRSDEARFVVVASPEAPALREARFFLERLVLEGMPTAGLVVNRMTSVPDVLHDDRGTAPLRAAAGCLRGHDGDGDGAAQERAVAALLELAADHTESAAREAEEIIRALTGIEVPAVVRVPRLATDVHDLQGLRAIGALLCGG